MSSVVLTANQAASKLRKAMAEKLGHNGAEELVDALYDLATGCRVLEYDEEGEAHVYSRKPDQKALTYLFDRFLGKPTEHKETHTTKEMRVTLALGQPGKENLHGRVLSQLPAPLDTAHEDYEDVVEGQIVPESKPPMKIRVRYQSDDEL